MQNLRSDNIKYRKKPVVIDAWRYTEETQVEIWGILHLNNIDYDIGDGELFINTLEGTMKANMGDYIIRGVNGEFYPCKPDIFEQTYEVVE